MAHLPVAATGETLSISGAALASLLHRATSSPADADGLLFGQISRSTLPSAADDHHDPTTTTTVTTVVSISGHISLSSPSSFSDPVGRVDPSLLSRLSSSSTSPFQILGWFSSRRRTPPRPSMRDVAISHSLSKTLTLNSPNPNPCIFLLITSSTSPNLSTHSYDYRAYTIAPGGTLLPRSLRVVNVGPAFRDQYSAFAPQSPMPELPCRSSSTGGGSTLGGMKQTAKDQKVLDGLAEGFKVERLERLVGARGETGEMEELYKAMLRKLEVLARQVERSAARVLQQVNGLEYVVIVYTDCEL